MPAYSLPRTVSKVVIAAIMFCTAALTVFSVAQDGQLPAVVQSSLVSIGVFVLLTIYSGVLVNTCWKNEADPEAEDATLARVVATFLSAMAFLMFLGALVYYGVVAHSLK
ncbi:hypothetical protein [Dyella telluris]|uniref:Uncharacterized protein n=1 Tax=Dyella telluris TaxID=2763498 RepID=A0A7G8Q2C7_9GAMM|nr:hypothetical protein [Dyella telluris]QNK00935.1 hypothetical protein H8F01_17950 [Dyella telluris]